MTRITLRTLLALLLLSPISIFSQTVSVQGRVLEAKTKTPLPGAHVKLINSDDPSQSFISSTDERGVFKFSGILKHSYTLEATYVGCNMFTKTVRVETQPTDLADLLLTQIPIQLGEVDVEGSPPPAVQKADTTEFNAGAFKTNPDAVAEDLVGKLPGVIVTNGTVTAQGEAVQQVLVDGKPFFGSDPTLALRNLPADAIAKIQIFDKMSDQAEFTGFDDGQSVKTLNIITRTDKRNQQFGKGYGGYGDDDRYIAGGSANYFHQGTRLSAIGLSNDLNQQNFSTQDLLGVVGNTNQRGGFGGGGGGGFRGGGGGGGAGFGGGGGPGGGGANISNFLVGQQNGVATTNSVGLNYTDSWGSHLSVTQSYFFNYTNTDNDQKLHMQYFPTPDSSTFYDENSAANSKNGNHRADMRLEYNADTLNSIIELPRLYFQNNNSASTVGGVNSLSTQQLINQTMNDNNAGTNGDNLSNHLVLRHKFDLPGRTISLDLGTSYNQKRGTTSQQAASEYYQGTRTTADTLNQQTPIFTDGYTVSSRLAYTEPIDVLSLLQFTYNPSYSRNNSDNKKYNFDPATGEYTIPDTSLSNTYQNQYWTQNGGIAYRIRLTGFNGMAGVSYQVAALRGQQQFPLTTTITRTYYDFLPNGMLTYNIAEHTNLRMFYRTTTQAPSISQLQNVVDNSNPLQLATGNPSLNESYTQTLTTRYMVTNVDNNRSTFLLLSIVHTNQYIGNATVTAQRDTVLSGGVVMNRGTQLSFPVNLNGQWNVNSFFTHSIVVGFLKSNLNLTSGLTYARTPGLINQALNIADTYGPGAGAVLSSNVSEKIDFTLSYNGNYNISRNSFEPDLNSQYYSHTATIKTNLIFWDGMVFRSEVDNALYSGLSGGYNKNSVLWNMSFGKKFFSKQQGELTASVVDLLNQNKSVNRTVTGTYVEDTQNNVLGRYFMLTFTYTVR
ncbi:MAG TPA: outer membrane beta-barrel protein [Bacteroidota bacterium]|nr:outer membrane beta-barrel protein [Bacteroidota bacterium]